MLGHPPEADFSSSLNRHEKCYTPSDSVTHPPIAPERAERQFGRSVARPLGHLERDWC